MAQRNDQAEKKRVLFDGEEIEGLVSVSEIALEKGTIDVPEGDRIRRIQNGVSQMPEVELTYKIRRDGAAMEFFRQYYVENQSKDVIIIRVNAAGDEFARTLLQDCECSRYVEPAYDAASPTYAQVSVRLLPWEVTPLDPA
jgi:hypothetical protein